MVSMDKYMALGGKIHSNKNAISRNEIEFIWNSSRASQLKRNFLKKVSYLKRVADLKEN